MINVNQTENGSFWELKGKLDFVDRWFLMSSPVPMVVITAAYILLVLKIGPELMKTRQPFRLKNVIVLYNIVQVFISFYLFYLCSRLMLANGFISKTCLLEKEETRQSLSTMMYYYFLAKVSETLDTIFFVLRKKNNQITFLHVYHHAMMIVTSWAILKYEPTYSTVFIRNINSFVHVIMYVYYGLSTFPSLAKYLWWKKYITTLQLVQFALILIHFVITYTVSECTLSYPLCLTITFNTTLMIFLFGKFYMESYSTKDNITKEKNARAKQDAIKSGTDKIRNTNKMGNKANGISQSDNTSITNGNSLLHRNKLIIGNE